MRSLRNTITGVRNSDIMQWMAHFSADVAIALAFWTELSAAILGCKLLVDLSNPVNLVIEA